jgi:ABC-type lipoprotein export system ATPase subunit
MLEVKNLVKIYKPKKGVPVKAIDDISLKLPDKGMVFLLGKSGSGKSTLLHLLSGLDRYEGGEIIIKGVSSKSFKQQHFDSYRNTYVGFIFQDYNVLDDFTVGANIALAIELQGRKATDQEVNKILKEVDLEGYGARKPNELSGGQKQRVAIARALVKSPEIIMADEPTGALDSNTGKQVFDTLKKLSSDKLVIIVSHDREFAETYADRIIELADGKVISDLENEIEVVAKTEEFSEGLEFNGNLITVPKGYTITEEDRIAINNYLLTLSDNAEIKALEKKSNHNFRPTDTSKIEFKKGGEFKLIKSKLPMKSAFKMGSSGLKYKKIRLVFTIILSCVAFTLFGLADTFGAYNHVKTCTNSLIDTGVTYASVVKSVKNGDYWTDWGYKLSNSDLESLKSKLGYEFVGVYNSVFEGSLDFTQNFDGSVELSKGAYNLYPDKFSGFTEISPEVLDRMDYKILAGAMPNGTKDEIAISEYVYKTFNLAGYIEVPQYEEISDNTATEPYDKEFYGNNENDMPSDIKVIAIKNYNDIIGKTICLNGENYTVTAVIDTGFNFDRYKSLIEENENIEFSEQAIQWFLASELDVDANYSLHATAMLGEGGIERMVEKDVQVVNSDYGFFYESENYFLNGEFITTLGKIDPSLITWVDTQKTALSEKEIIVTKDLIYDRLGTYDTQVGEYIPAETDNDFIKQLKNLSLKMTYVSEGKDVSVDGVKIVGYIDTDKITSVNIYSTIVTDDGFYSKKYASFEGVYDYALAPMPSTKSGVRDLVKCCYDTSGNVRYTLQSAVTHELDVVDEILDIVGKVFLYIGIGFAVFASLMLSNFIATSISYKKREIGILRAIGSRSNDVFRIFFAESFIIAMINFVLSTIGTFIITVIINSVFRNSIGILITILSFGVRQILLLFIISLAVAFIASFIPVKRIASKRPIDAIRDR